MRGVKKGQFRPDELEIVAPAPPPDRPPLVAGDWCRLNSDVNRMLVVDCDEENVVIATSDGEWSLPRACVRRA